jgi:diguanylate cyclase (GGDEF)-like protein
MLDIDHFKKVNDTYGHQAGDKILVKVCKITKFNLREVDILGRYGGEEFMVILPNNNIHNGYLVAERIRKSIEKQNHIKDLKVTISGGIVELKEENGKELVEKADNLLYKAKRNGRNRIEM